MARKILMVGDLHGELPLVEFLDKERRDFHILFLGDILDSFTNSVTRQIDTLKLICQMIEKEQAECIFGNHELSYIEPRMRCSGYNPVTVAHFAHLRSRVNKLFIPFKYFKDAKVLVTHAGLTYPIWLLEKLSFDNLEETLQEWFRIWDSPFYNIGRSRGGIDDFGGPFWCDFQKDFYPIQGLTQVFGHSNSPMPPTTSLDVEGGRGIRIANGHNYNIDCLTREYELLEFDPETAEFKIHSLSKEEVRRC